MIYLQSKLFISALFLWVYPFYLVTKFYSLKQFLMIDVLYPLFLGFNLFQLLWHNYFIISKFSLIHIFQVNYIPFDIFAKEKSTFSTSFPLQMNIFSYEQALCYLPYGLFYSLIMLVAPWNNRWKKKLLTCLSKWNPFRSSSVPTVANELYSLRQLCLLYVRQIFGNTLKKKVFLGVWQLGPIYYLLFCLC